MDDEVVSLAVISDQELSFDGQNSPPEPHELPSPTEPADVVLPQGCPPLNADQVAMREVTVEITASDDPLPGTGTEIDASDGFVEVNVPVEAVVIEAEES